MKPRSRYLLWGLPALAALAIASSASAAPAPAAERTQDAVRATRLTNDWSSWRAGRVGAAAGITRSKARRLVIRLGSAAKPGATAFYRLRLPASLTPKSLRFRVTYATTGGNVFIASGTRTRKVWSKGAGRRGTRVTGTVALKGRRTIFIGARASATTAPRRVVLIVHSYAITPRDTGAGGVVPVPKRPIYWGARIGGNVYGAGFGDGPWDAQTVSLFAQHAGKAPSIILWGQPWYRNKVAQTFDPAPFQLARDYGAIPMVDWASWEAFRGGHYDQPDFQLQDIIGGNYDSFIRDWASDAAAWGHPFFLRFDHEMNGTWYPYSELRNGNKRGQFIQAWRHVHDIFVQQGATNVTWVWSPNEIQGSDDIPLPSLYPGAAYVDWVGWDGYNWGNNQNSVWLTFEQRMGRTYDALRALAPNKPLMIAEMGSSETGGGSKAAWINDAFGVRLPGRYSAVKAVIWWNRVEKGYDWPIESSPSAQAAFARQIGSPYYLSNTFSTLDASPIPPP